MNIKYVYWELSNYCNLRCKQCFAKAIRDESTIVDKSVLYKAIEKISYKQNLSIRFGGGEPLLVPYLPELIKYCTNKKINVDITSNGLLLNDEILHRLILSGLRELTISIDGLESTNDLLRGKGSYSIVNNIVIRTALLHEISVSIGFTVTRTNYREINEFVEDYIEKGIRKFYFFRYCGNNGREMCSLNKEQLYKAAVTIYRLKIKYPKIQFIYESLGFYSFLFTQNHCFEGCNFLKGVTSINYKGDVVVCAAINKSLGNIYKDDMGLIYSNIEDEKKLLQAIPYECKDCAFNHYCRGGCKGENYRSSNSYFGKDPLCFKSIFEASVI